MGLNSVYSPPGKIALNSCSATARSIRLRRRFETCLNFAAFLTVFRLHVISFWRQGVELVRTWFYSCVDCIFTRGRVEYFLEDPCVDSKSSMWIIS